MLILPAPPPFESRRCRVITRPPLLPRAAASFCRHAARFTAMLAAVSLAAPVSAATVEFGPPPGAELSREKLSPIDDFVNGEVASGRIPGAIVLIQHHGEPVYFRSFGKRDVEKGTPMTADTIFPIHSVTKTVTSVAAMMLVDRGKIALDDPVSKYIPSFAGMKVGVERKTIPAVRRSTWCRCAGSSPSRICCCTPPASPMASMAKGW
jgi:CubicO group peptidase (beta-lactamase class C family)